MSFSENNLQKRKKYLSSDLLTELDKKNESKTDYFTQTYAYPKAFRVGKCTASAENSTSFEVVLFWRTNEESIQKEIIVETTKERDKWLINSVSLRK